MKLADHDGFAVTELAPGVSVTFAKTVSESDVYLFAGITGDFSPNHVNEALMRETRYGQRVAHGVLTLGLASTAASLMVERTGSTAVSYGYDRVRFVGAVFFGDTLRVSYRIDRIEPDRRKAYADVEVHNDRGELCLVAEHILMFLEDAD